MYIQEDLVIHISSVHAFLVIQMKRNITPLAINLILVKGEMSRKSTQPHLLLLHLHVVQEMVEREFKMVYPPSSVLAVNMVLNTEALQPLVEEYNEVGQDFAMQICEGRYAPFPDF